jgi:exopolyphosphatase/guanosine-5'-triphosphate,3'-diphosphate pyrophosphatase
VRAAAIDIGSNSLLLTIAEAGQPQKIPLKLIVDEAHVTGLSKGLAHGKIITDASFEKSAKVFFRYAKLIEENKCDEVKVVATEALRRASNGDQIKKKIEDILKHPVELISGPREAELSFWSVQKEFGSSAKPILVFDIGGASTELCLGSSTGIQQRISLKVGSVVLSETFGLQSVESPEKAIEYVRKMIKEVPWLKGIKDATGVGVAGTITSLFAIHLNLEKYSRAAVHHSTMNLEAISAILDRVMAMDTPQRGSITGLSLDRADVFGGGLSIVKAIMLECGWNQITCMDSGVRFGVLYEILGI